MAAAWSGDAGRSSLEGVAVVSGSGDDVLWVESALLTDSAVLGALSQHGVCGHISRKN